jgi:antitoxin HigA-1
MKNPYEITDPVEQRNFRVGPMPHPGGWIRDVLLDALHLSDDDAAAELGVDGAALRRVLDGAAPVTADLAGRLSELTGVESALLLNMQASHDRDSVKP